MQSQLTNEELLLWLRGPEHHFVERKSYGDWKKDALKTAVAFANSAPVGSPAVLFIGVKDNGIIEPEQNLDETQKTFAQKLSSAYPSIYYETRIVHDEQGLRCLAIIIPGSDQRPHFSGRSFVRVGSESREASEEQFRNLIAERSGKCRELLEWKDKVVIVRPVEVINHGVKHRLRVECTLLDCNQFYVTVLHRERGITLSYALSSVELSFDHDSQRLAIEID